MSVVFPNKIREAGLSLIALPLRCWWSQYTATSIAVYEAAALLVHAVFAKRQAAVTDSVLAVGELAHRTERAIRSVGSDSEAAGGEVLVTAS